MNVVDKSDSTKIVQPQSTHNPMEEPEDPQVPIPTEATAEVKRPADPNTPSKSIAIPGADQSRSVNQGKIRRPPPLQKSSDDRSSTGSTSPSNAPPPQPHSTTTAVAAVAALDEDRIESTRDMSINPADVLSGRGKQAFNHGTFVRSFLETMRNLARYSQISGPVDCGSMYCGALASLQQTNLDCLGSLLRARDYSTGSGEQILS